MNSITLKGIRSLLAILGLVSYCVFFNFTFHLKWQLVELEGYLNFRIWDDMYLRSLCFFLVSLLSYKFHQTRNPNISFF